MSNEINGRTTDRATLAGTVRKVIFCNPENGFSVFEIAARSHREPVVVVGLAPPLDEGMSITASGKWSVHAKFGRQFKAEFVKPEPPGTLAGLTAYLGSKAVAGIGKVHAKRLVEKFGEGLFDIIENSPQRLREVEGIGKVRVRQITEAWQRHRTTRETMVYLHGLGLGPAMAATIYRIYGNDAVRIVSSNPYCLISDVRGVGFKTADGLAERTGISREHPARIIAGLHHLVSEAISSGNTGIQREQLLEQAVGLLDVSVQSVRDGLGEQVRRGRLLRDEIGGETCVFQPDLYAAEQEIAARLRSIADCGISWAAIETDKAIKWVERQDDIQFGESQKRAIEIATAAKFTVITGGPGVGKTTIVNAILKILSKLKIRIKICAPTGRAAKRASELTGRPAQTIHRLLEIDPETGKFRHNSENPIDCDLIIVDESSMIDVLLMHALLQAIPNRAAVIMVGDVDQLPSVGPGRVLGDVLDSGTVQVVRLTEIYRQAAASRVVANAHRINAGLMPDLSRPAAGSDFYFVAAREPEEAMSQVVAIVSDRIPDRFGFDPVRDVQVLCPMIRGRIGVDAMNATLREVLNPGAANSLVFGNASYSPGDKVMQIHNNYSKGIFNGDVGIVCDIFPDQSSLHVDFDGRILLLGPDEIPSITLAYAVTIHKSQGCEFPAVVVPVMTQHYIMLQRNLLYTAVTRARELVVMVGQQRAVEIAVRTDFQHRRLTRLGELLSPPSGNRPESARP